MAHNKHSLNFIVLFFHLIFILVKIFVLNFIFQLESPLHLFQLTAQLEVMVIMQEQRQHE